MSESTQHSHHSHHSHHHSGETKKQHLHHSTSSKRRFGKRLRSKFKKLKKHPVLFVGALFSLGALIIAVYGALIPRFAQLYSNLVAHPMRVAIGSIFSIVPVSAAEILIVFFGLFCLCWLVMLVRALIRKYRDKERPRRKHRKLLWTPVCVVWVIALMFFYLFFPSYMRPTLASTLNLNREEITDKDFYAALNFFVAEINSDVKQLSFKESGSSVMNTSFSAIASEINNDYIHTNEVIPQIMGNGALAKPLISSPILLNFHLSGVYTFFTGEANVNTAYPDFIVPFTIAHEAAHMRGIARENDATLAGFIACSNSENPYVRYSGYLNLLCEMLPEINSYLADLNETDPEFAAELTSGVQGILDRLDPRVKGELKAYSEFFEPYRDSALAEVSNELNDSYLKAQGQSEGILSYQNLTGFTVQYYVSYLK